MKYLLPLFFISTLNAAGINEDDLGSIYKEAILFVSIFGTMGILSFFISRKNAKQYDIDNPLEERRAKNILKKEKKKKDIIKRISEISKLYDNKLISKKELQLLKNNIDELV